MKGELMENIKKVVNNMLKFSTVLLFLVMVAVTIWQVIARYILQDPSSSTEEFVRFSLVWLSLLSSAYVVGTKGHLAITLLSDRLKYQQKIILEMMIQISFLVFSIFIMIYGGLRAVSISMSQISPALNIPMGLIYLALPVTGLFIIFYSSINIIELFKQNKRVSAKTD